MGPASSMSSSLSISESSISESSSEGPWSSSSMGSAGACWGSAGGLGPSLDRCCKLEGSWPNSPCLRASTGDMPDQLRPPGCETWLGCWGRYAGLGAGAGSCKEAAGIGRVGVGGPRRSKRSGRLGEACGTSAAFTSDALFGSAACSEPSCLCC